MVNKTSIVHSLFVGGNKSFLLHAKKGKKKKEKTMNRFLCWCATLCAFSTLFFMFFRYWVLSEKKSFSIASLSRIPPGYWFEPRTWPPRFIQSKQNTILQSYFLPVLSLRAGSLIEIGNQNWNSFPSIMESQTKKDVFSLTIKQADLPQNNLPPQLLTSILVEG